MFSTGENTPTDKLVDYIIGSGRAEEIEKDDICADNCNEQKNEVSYIYTIILYSFGSL